MTADSHGTHIGGYLRIAAYQRWLQTVIRFRAWRRAKRRLFACVGHMVLRLPGVQITRLWRTIGLIGLLMPSSTAHRQASWPREAYSVALAGLTGHWATGRT